MTVNLGDLKKAIDKAFDAYGPDIPVYIEIDRIFQRTASNCLDLDSLSVAIQSVYSDSETGSPAINISSVDPNEAYIFRPNESFLEDD